MQFPCSYNCTFMYVFSDYESIFHCSPCPELYVDNATNVSLGTNVSLTCYITGYQISAQSYSWRRIDNVFDNPVERFTGQNTAVLTIADVGVNDAKTYVCTATIERKIFTAKGTLSVIGEEGKWWVI